MIVSGIPFKQALGDWPDSDGRHFGIAIHATDNTASDTGEASYASWRPDKTSAHFYVDRDSVTQAVDTRHKTGHAGSGTGNENAISVEITGLSTASREWWLVNVYWDTQPGKGPGLGAVLARVIRAELPGFQVRHATVAEMKSNPKVMALYGHDDMRRAWGGTDHTDPGPGFPWDRLISAINAALANGGGTVADVDKLGGRTIKQGDQGNAVFELRSAMVRLGFLASLGDGQTSGTFDAGLTAAVKAYQSSRFGWAKPDGVVDAGGQTATKLIAELAALDAAIPPPPAPVTGTPAPGSDLAPVMAELTALRGQVTELVGAVSSLRAHLGDAAE